MIRTSEPTMTKPVVIAGHPSIGPLVTLGLLQEFINECVEQGMDREQSVEVTSPTDRRYDTALRFMLTARMR